MLDASAPTYVYGPDLIGDFVATRSPALVSHFSTCPKAGDFSASKPKTDQHGPIPQATALRRAR